MTAHSSTSSSATASDESSQHQHAKDALITPHAVLLSQTAPRCPPSRYRTDPNLRKMTRATRSISRVLPVAVQNGLRDIGAFRWIADAMVTSLAVPVGAVACPSAVADFVRLSQNRTTLRYGNDDDSQFVDVFFPDKEGSGGGSVSGGTTSTAMRGMVVFVHGGAWGSGKPWFYRLVALPFLELGLAVAIVGYRVYPVCGVPSNSNNNNGNSNRNSNSNSNSNNNDNSNPRGGVLTQVDDLEAALGALAREYPEWCDKNFADRLVSDSDDINTNANPKPTKKHDHHLPHVGTIVVGHSSGAHIALLWIIERAQREIATSSSSSSSRSQTTNSHNNHQHQNPTTTASTTMLPRIDAFVGLSGVYNIDHHFDYESGRSVQELSPLKPANGHDRTEFLKHSPPWKIQHELLRSATHCSEVLENGNSSKSKSNSVAIPERWLLIHGAEDDVVPLPATGEAARIFKHALGGTSSSTSTSTSTDTQHTHADIGNLCIDEVYIPKTGHQEVVVDLMMLGGRKGPVTTAVIDWLRSGNKHLHERDQQQQRQTAQTQTITTTQNTGARLRSKL